jgi:uncharacterized paraquat-inducible protein A
MLLGSEYARFVSKEQAKGTTLIPSYTSWLEREVEDTRVALAELGMHCHEKRKQEEEQRCPACGVPMNVEAYCINGSCK